MKLQTWRLTSGRSGLIRYLESEFCMDSKFVHDVGITIDICDPSSATQQWKHFIK